MLQWRMKSEQSWIAASADADGQRNGFVGSGLTPARATEGSCRFAAPRTT